MSDFQKDLEHLINRYSKENGSDTPDHILAQYLQSCLDAFNVATNERDRWFGNPPPERIEFFSSPTSMHGGNGLND